MPQRRPTFAHRSVSPGRSSRPWVAIALICSASSTAFADTARPSTAVASTPTSTAPVTPTPTSPAPAVVTPAATPLDQRSAVPAWLPWTFAGVGVASALTSVLAWRVRERQVERFNSAACLEDGRTRVQVCADEYYAGRDAQAVVWVTGIGSIAFLGSAFFLGQTRAAVSASTSSVRVLYSGAF